MDIYAQIAAQLGVGLLRSEQEIREIEQQAEQNRRRIELQQMKIDQLRREYEEKLGPIIDLSPDDVRVVEEPKLIGASDA